MSIHSSKYHIVENLMPRLIWKFTQDTMKSLLHMRIKTVSDPTEEKNKRFFVKLSYFPVLDLLECEKEGQIHHKGNADRQ